MSRFFVGSPDHKPDLSGLDDGPYLPGRAPRKKPPPKTAEELRAIRAKAWATRRSAKAVAEHPGEASDAGLASAGSGAEATRVGELPSLLSSEPVP